jgi:tetratricopeptide (TPR) repeat protein
MELTVDQMLQQGVAAHNAGNLQEAERLYRTILQVQPKHPDANHNLGLIAVSMNQSGVALPLFKSAIDVKPNIEQFWLSYIEALIAERQFENAKRAIKKGKKKGVSKEKLKALTQKLVSVKAGDNPIQAPSQVEIQKLLNHYQNGQYGDAETLAISITEQFPEHQFGWKMLGAVLRQTNRISESLVPSQKSVELAPQDAEAHNNLGATLKELGRLEEAEASARQAIALKSDFAGAYSNLGATLQALGRLDESEESLRQAIALKSDWAEAHNNLGITLNELGRLEESEASSRQAIALKPDYVAAHYNLGLVFIASGKYEEAIEHFSLIKYEKSKSYLLMCLYLQDKKSLFFDQLDTLINQGEISPIIGSLGCRSVLSYGIERPNLFCKEPLKYVLKTDLKNQHDFGKIFVNTAITILNGNRVEYRAQALLTNGSQTYGNLFDLEPDFTEEIQKIIRAEVDNYRFNFKDSEEGLIKNWPADYSISGWLVSMKNGGELRPHMHEEGWISGSIYINVPPKLKTDSGNLVVCIEDEKFLRKGVNNPKVIIDVVTGSLALFPASLFHYTIPFESDEERIVLAFDVIPK